MKKIFYNGIVYCGKGEFAEAFSVEDGRFAEVGSNNEVLETKKDDDETVDLGGRFVCAGFNDSHMHLLNYGRLLNSVGLAGKSSSLNEVLDEIRAFIADNDVPAGAWVTAIGWNQDYFQDEKRMPDRYDLDDVSREHPIIAYRCCEHVAAVNSKALEVLGIDERTACPEGGEIGAENGIPNGLFYDNAIRILEERMPAPGHETLKKYIRDAARALNAYGITSCQSDDYSTFRNVSWREINDIYRELEGEGKLSVRVYEQCNFAKYSDLVDFINEGNYTGLGGDRFRIGPLKMLGDGSLGARTALLSRPYEDAPEGTGLGIYTQKEFDDFIALANRNNMSVAVHAIGDRCLDMVLSAIEKALADFPRENHRHGIVHCQITRPDQLEKIARLGLHVYAQTVFLDYDNHIVEARVGAERAATSYSWKSLMKMGGTVSNGSDCPVEMPDALRGIQCAVTRTSMDGTGPYLPDEAFTVAEAIDSFTIMGAYASFEEDIKGRICKGYLADFIILEENPFEVEQKNISKIKVIS